MSREISGAFETHLKTGATTTCRCWWIKRKDGVGFGFTDHDRRLVLDDNVPNLDYAANWFEETKQERLLDGLSGYLSERLDPGLSAGKITLFRLFRKYPAQHVGIILAAPNERLTLIHSISGQGVVEVPMSEKWQARVVAQFRI